LNDTSQEALNIKAEMHKLRNETEATGNLVKEYLTPLTIFLDCINWVTGKKIIYDT